MLQSTVLSASTARRATVSQSHHPVAGRRLGQPGKERHAVEPGDLLRTGDEGADAEEQRHPGHEPEPKIQGTEYVIEFFES